MSESTTQLRPVTITEKAAQRIAALMAEEASPDLMLRIAVSGGGCSGFQYNFTFDEAAGDTDFVIKRDGATVLVDETSLELLKGSEIDYVEDMIGASFQIKNPQAKSTCGCGNSFSV